MTEALVAQRDGLNGAWTSEKDITGAPGSVASDVDKWYPLRLHKAQPESLRLHILREVDRLFDHGKVVFVELEEDTDEQASMSHWPCVFALLNLADSDGVTVVGTIDLFTSGDLPFSSKDFATTFLASERREKVDRRKVDCEARRDIIPSKLLGMPPEVRLMIWSYALNVGSLCPYTKTRYLLDPPALNLLKASGQVWVEAQPVLFENRLVLDSIGAVQEFIKKVVIPVRSPVRSPRIKSIKTTLSVSDMTGEACAVSVHKAREARLMADMYPTEHAGRFPHTRWEFIHHFIKLDMKKIWASKLTLIVSCIKPRMLEIDLCSSFCKDGCCYLLAVAIDAIREVFERYPSTRFRLMLPDHGSQDSRAGREHEEYEKSRYAMDQERFRILCEIESLGCGGCRALPTDANGITEAFPTLLDVEQEEFYAPLKE